MTVYPAQTNPPIIKIDPILQAIIVPEVVAIAPVTPAPSTPPPTTEVDALHASPKAMPPRVSDAAIPTYDHALEAYFFFINSSNNSL